MLKIRIKTWIKRELKANKVSFKMHIKSWLNGWPKSKFGVWHPSITILTHFYISFMIHKKCYFSNTQLVISNIYYCYVFHLNFFSLRNLFSKTLQEFSGLFQNGQMISFLYLSFRKYSLRMLYNMFLYFKLIK